MGLVYDAPAGTWLFYLHNKPVVYTTG